MFNMDLLTYLRIITRLHLHHIQFPLFFLWLLMLAISHPRKLVSVLYKKRKFAHKEHTHRQTDVSKTEVHSTRERPICINLIVSYFCSVVVFVLVYVKVLVLFGP